MTTRYGSPARGVLPIRLNESERVLAEALARLHGESTSAGFGIREALRMAHERLRDSDDGERLESLMAEVRAERAAKGRR